MSTYCLLKPDQQEEFLMSILFHKDKTSKVFMKKDNSGQCVSSSKFLQYSFFWNITFKL